MKLDKRFYQRSDVNAIAIELLGKVLCTVDDRGAKTCGMIVETEAYKAPEDKASHAFGNRRTKRTETMFGSGGRAYVYLCYGIHHLFNVVTNVEDVAHAVLVRGVEPLEGIDVMLERRNRKKVDRVLTGGPGILSKALGISTADNNTDLTGGHIWLEDRGISVSDESVIKSPRVGVDYAGEWAKKPWRYRIKGNNFTSKPDL